MRAAKAKSQIKCEQARTMIDLFRTLEGKYSLWPLWCDFVTMLACNLSLLDVAQREKRQKLYNMTAEKYTEAELRKFSELTQCTVDALEENPNQDFLGDLYMRMELGNNQNGQFFTPYNVSLMMAKMNAGDPAAEIAEKGWITVNDCCCGAGAMLVAYANAVREQGVNYQEHVLFVGQDIDFVATMMCFIQLSLLGCPGYVAHGNTLTTPITENLNPDLDVWYTPLYFSDNWHYRRIVEVLKGAERPHAVTVPAEAYEYAETKAGQLVMF